MTFETLVENLGIFLIAIGGLWVGANGTLTKFAKPVLHQFRDRYLKKHPTWYQVILQGTLAIVAFGMTFAAPEVFDFFAVFNPNIKSVAGLFEYQHWMGNLAVATPLVVFAGEYIHDMMDKDDKPQAIPNA